ncbi:MAG: ribosomal protein [Actinomycetota bacterium]
MGIRKRKPTSAGRRFQTVSDFADITKSTPEKSLLAKKTSALVVGSYEEFNNESAMSMHCSFLLLARVYNCSIELRGPPSIGPWEDFSAVCSLQLIKHTKGARR